MLFLDEPTTGLDPASRAGGVGGDRAAWSTTAPALVLTTQYLEEADQLADRVGIIDEGRIGGGGTPGELKAEIGRSRLEIRVSGADNASATEVLGRFGDLQPTTNGTVSVAIEGGATLVAPIVRALDEAGLAVEALDLHEPTLDDVFVEKTGRHLEGAEEQAAAPA